MSGVSIKSSSDNSGAIVTAFAPAKINLFLHIVGRREDGRHGLESIFAFADVGDRLSIAPAVEFSLSLSGPFADDLGDSDAGDNLVMQAARKLAARLGPAAFPVALELEKNLPVAAGIGGGSADAAAALCGLSKIWDSHLPEEELQELALELGADVPACLVAVTARVTGIGENIEAAPASTGQFYAVLANPDVRLSTAAVFERYRAISGGFSKPLEQWPDSGTADILDALADCRNDLSEAAMAEAPVIGDVLGALEKQQNCRLARMSGSGATCFALFDDPAAAGRAARSLSEDRPEWWVKAATLGQEM